MSLPLRELPANRFCGFAQRGLRGRHARAQRRAESGRTCRSVARPGGRPLCVTERQVWRGWYVALSGRHKL